MTPVTQEELDLAAIAFRDFCEGDLSESHPFQHAWDRWESHHGEIEYGMPLCSLIQAAILYGIQHERIRAANAEHDAKLPKPSRDVELEKAQALLDRMVVGTAWRTKEGMSPDERYDRVWLSVSWLQESIIFDFAAMTADGESWVEWALEDLTADFFRAHDSWEPDPERLVSAEKSTRDASHE